MTRRPKRVGYQLSSTASPIVIRWSRHPRKKRQFFHIPTTSEKTRKHQRLTRQRPAVSDHAVQRCFNDRVGRAEQRPASTTCPALSTTRTADRIFAWQKHQHKHHHSSRKVYSAGGLVAVLYAPPRRLRPRRLRQRTSTARATRLYCKAARIRLLAVCSWHAKPQHLAEFNHEYCNHGHG